MQTDILISGAGATGLAAAIALARDGHRVEILGVPEALRDDSRSAAIFEANLEWLDRFGMGAPLRARGAPLRAIRIIDLTARLFRAPEVTFRAIEIGQEAFGVNVPNFAILSELLAIARETPGLRLRHDRLARLRMRENARIVQLSNGERISARLMISADGQESRTRAAAGIGAKRAAYPQMALTLRLEHGVDHADTSLEFHTREGPFTFVPLPAPDGGGFASALVWMMAPPRARALHALADEALARAIERESYHALGPLRVLGGRGLVPMQRLLASELVAPRVALIGEAAHAFPPIGAQGLDLGFRDVAALVKAIRTTRGGDPGAAAVLEAYRAARIVDIRLRSAGVHGLNSALILGNPLVDLARLGGISLLKRLPPARSLAMRLGGWSFAPAR